MSHLLDPFATPILVAELADDALAEEVTTRLVAEAAATPGVQRSVVGGWHGPPDVPIRPEPCFRQATAAVVRAVREAAIQRAAAIQRTLPAPLGFQAHGWGVVVSRGGYAEPHDHAESHWSAIWYADPGDPPEAALPTSGRLAFLDPRGAIGPGGPIDLFPRTFSVQPRRGMIVVFPGWLTHYVHPYVGRRPRVSVAFNVMLSAPSAPDQSR